MLIQEMPIIRTLIQDTEKKIRALTGMNVKIRLDEFPINDEIDELLYMLEQVSIVFNVPAGAITGKKRTRRNGLMDARHTLFYVTHKVMGFSCSQVGIVYGKKDHTTVLNGCHNIIGFLDVNDPVKDKVDEVISKIRPCK